MRRGRSSVSDFLTNFNAAFDTVNRVGQEFETSKVASAKPVESTGFTAEQGRQLESLAKQGFDNITFDEAAGAYVAKNAAGDAKTVAMQGVTDFMGTRHAGQGPQVVDTARAQAYADAVSKYDPAKGMQLRRQASQDEREGARFARETKQWAREDSIEAIDQEMGAALKASMVDKDGKPVQPTPDLYLANIQQRAGRLAQAGHSKQAQEAMLQYYGMADAKIRHDAKQREQDAVPAMAAFQSGNTQALVDYYNKYVPGGTKISSIERGKDGAYVISAVGPDGQALPSRTVDERGILAMAQSLNDPKVLLQHAWDEANFGLRLRGEARAENADRRADNADRRAAAADGRAATTHAQSQADRRETRSVLEALYREKNPGATPAQIAAAGLGKITVPGTGGGVDQVSRLSTLKDVKAKADATRPKRKDFGSDKRYEEAVRQWEATDDAQISREAGMRMREVFGHSSVRSASPAAGGAIQQLPEGAKQIGTSGGRPVYELPDGRRVVSR